MSSPLPHWVSRPTADEVAAEYPAQAQRRGISGRAVISCEVLPTGRMGTCHVVEESPVGQEFGRAALRLARYFAMTPLPPGVPRGTVNIPIGFRTANQ